MTIDPGALKHLFQIICGSDSADQVLSKFAMLRGLSGARAVVLREVQPKLHASWTDPQLRQMGAWRSRFQGHCFCGAAGRGSNPQYAYVVVRETNPVALALVTVGAKGCEVEVAAEESEAEELMRQLKADLAEGPLDDASAVGRAVLDGRQP